jgi:hypothetical protein
MTDPEGLAADLVAHCSAQAAARMIVFAVFHFFLLGSAFHPRLDVLVHPKEILWIVFILQGHKTGIGRGHLGSLNASQAFITPLSQIIDIDAARRVGR